MRKILWLLALLSLGVAKEKVFINEGENELANYNEVNKGKKEVSELYQNDKIQLNFFSHNRSGKENIQFIIFNKSKTYSIRTREAMASTIVLENDEIKKVITSDKEGFDFVEVDKNIISIVPKIIGIDSNLTLVGKSGALYNFYIFSTSIKNSKARTLITSINNNVLKNNSAGGGGIIILFLSYPKGEKLKNI